MQGSHLHNRHKGRAICNMHRTCRPCDDCTGHRTHGCRISSATLTRQAGNHLAGQHSIIVEVELIAHGTTRIPLVWPRECEWRPPVWSRQPRLHRPSVSSQLTRVIKRFWCMVGSTIGTLTTANFTGSADRPIGSVVHSGSLRISLVR